MLFESYPKIPRLSKECIITEKIDGTNAQIGIITDPLPYVPYEHGLLINGHWVFAGSRSRWLTPEQDNFGFCRWVRENAEALLQLGVGRHFGEWWGPGIQRGYGIAEKRFTLFRGPKVGTVPYPLVTVVPEVISKQVFSDAVVTEAIEKLKSTGSLVSPGIVIYHTASGQVYKKLIENDDKPKGEQ